MFAVYATHAAPDDPLAALKIGEQPEPDVPEGWVRVKITHASLNRHDLFTLRGISGHPEGITYPIILGNDAAGTLDDGTPVVIYPLMGSDDWRGDETLDPKWHIPSEFVHGTFADYAVVPRRNAIPLPKNLSPLHASVLGTAWLTAYRAALHQVGTSGRRDGAGPGRNRRYGDCAHPARSGSRLRGLGNEPLGRRSSAGQGTRGPPEFSVPTRRCPGKCRWSSIASGEIPGLTACHRSFGAERWLQSAVRQGSKSR